MDNEKTLIKIQSQDDSILNNCLQLKTTVKRVAILTEDINLMNKAMSSKIEAFDQDQLAKELKLKEFQE